jgi:hypothetical protein
VALFHRAREQTCVTAPDSPELGGQPSTADLVDLGWLPTPDCDKDALSHALIDLIERAIRARVTPSAGSEEGKVCFFCEFKRSTIDTLVELRWLRADQRDDLTAIVTAFRRFVGRSLDIARNGEGVQ